GGLAAGTYYYLVEAEDAAGNLSAPSNQASAVVAGDRSPPSVRAGLAVCVSGCSAALSWGASSDNVGVVRYDVFRSTSSGFSPGVSNRIAQPTRPSSALGGLAAGTYYYLVEAEDAAGNLSAPSNQASATISAPPPPSGLVAAYSFNE